MRKFLCVSAILALPLVGADGARAADVGEDRPVIYVPPVSAPFEIWSGCFVGVNAGGAIAQWQLREISPAPLQFSGKTIGSIAGGGQIGCDYQAGPWVFGAQGMIDGSDLTTAADQLGGLALRAMWTAAATGRVGYTIEPSVLAYVRAGGAWTQQGGVGWTVGAGIEWKFLPSWSLFVEYDYYRFGTKDLTSVTVPPFLASSGLDMKTLLVGVNYRFDIGPPVTTRY
jgi:outer membrane immunogenic protein